MIYGGCFYEPQALKFFSLMDIELFDSWKSFPTCVTQTLLM